MKYLNYGTKLDSDSEALLQPLYCCCNIAITIYMKMYCTYAQLQQKYHPLHVTRIFMLMGYIQGFKKHIN